MDTERELLDLAESAWGIIANAGGGVWAKESEEWVRAASKWRDKYHALLSKIPE